jgi:hypothetical protein
MTFAVLQTGELFYPPYCAAIPDSLCMFIGIIVNINVSTWVPNHALAFCLKTQQLHILNDTLSLQKVFKLCLVFLLH